MAPTLQSNEINLPVTFIIKKMKDMSFHQFTHRYLLIQKTQGRIAMLGSLFESIWRGTFRFFERVDGLPLQRAYQIKAYHDIGMEQKAIAAQLGVSQSCVSKTHRCIPQTGNFSSMKRSRLSRVTSKRTDQLRRRCFLKIPTISSTEIRFSLAWLDKVPSARTLPRRHSDEFRLKAYKPVRRPRLPKKNIPDRLRFAEATRHWDVAKRRKVMFSDESTILQFENFKFSKTPGKNALSAT